MHIDADHTFGHYSGAVAMKEAVKLAKKSGIACCSVSNSPTAVQCHILVMNMLLRVLYL